MLWWLNGLTSAEATSVMDNCDGPSKNSEPYSAEGSSDNVCMRVNVRRGLDGTVVRSWRGWSFLWR